MGVVSISPGGEIGMAFNCERMHRASIDINGKLEVAIYK
jgi:hypothetical protein